MPVLPPQQPVLLDGERMLWGPGADSMWSTNTFLPNPTDGAGLRKVSSVPDWLAQHGAVGEGAPLRKVHSGSDWLAQHGEGGPIRKVQSASEWLTQPGSNEDDELSTFSDLDPAHYDWEEDEVARAPPPPPPPPPAQTSLPAMPVVEEQEPETPDHDWTDKTTAMIRNVPTRYSKQLLLKEIDKAGFRGAYDFFYLPMDFGARVNLGYAFVNFTDPLVCAEFAAAFDGRHLKKFSSGKILQIAPADCQGLEANLSHFAKAAMQRISNPGFKPAVFEAGEPVPFAKAYTGMLTHFTGIRIH